MLVADRPKSCGACSIKGVDAMPGTLAEAMHSTLILHAHSAACSARDTAAAQAKRQELQQRLRCRSPCVCVCAAGGAHQAAGRGAGGACRRHLRRGAGAEGLPQGHRHGDVPQRRLGVPRAPAPQVRSTN